MFGHRTQPDSTEVQAIADRLGTVSFFEGFTADEIHRVAQLAERVVAEPGAVIIDQGRVGLECFVILEGAASVYISGEHVATLTPGAMVGEMALVEHRPRNATVVATDTLDLAAFNTDGFKKLLAEMPKANDRVMETLAARLKANTDHA
jgi:CRP-like cAMP-binding protein